MVGYQSYLKDKNKEFLEKFAKHSKVAGVIFLLLGLVGVFYPVVMSLTTAYFVAFLFLLSGFMIAFHTYNTDKKDWLGWLKAFLYLLTGILVTIYPVPGVAALGIILAVYFFMDGFTSFALAGQLKGQKYNWLIVINGILSIILGIIFLVNWPFGSLVLVGLFIGISLFFDGVVLLTMSSAIKKLEDSQDSSQDSSQA